MKPLPFHVVTGFADLVDRVHDAAFDDRFPANGSFVKIQRGERAYWYHMAYDASAPSKQRSRYAGPVGDPKVDALVAAHGRLHDDHKMRKALASSMRQAGLPAPDGIEGELALAFQKAGLFQAGAVLVGSVAYQSYGGVLGVRLDGAHHRTQDLDLAQDRSIALHVSWSGEQLGDFEAILKAVDPTFAPDFNPAHPQAGPTRYKNASQYRIDLLTGHLASDRNRTKPVPSPSVAGATLQPLEAMDFLIEQPTRSVLLHQAGAAVVVPHPARYAVHKMLVSQIRSLSSEATKSAKDLAQASELLRALAHARKQADVADAWTDLRSRPKLRRRLAAGALALDMDALAILAEAVRRHGGPDFPEGRNSEEFLRSDLAPKGDPSTDPKRQLACR